MREPISPARKHQPDIEFAGHPAGREVEPCEAQGSTVNRFGRNLASAAQAESAQPE